MIQSVMAFYIPLFDEIQGKGEALVVLLNKASLNAENLSSNIFCWKIMLIISSIIMTYNFKTMKENESKIPKQT